MIVNMGGLELFLISCVLMMFILFMKILVSVRFFMKFSWILLKFGMKLLLISFGRFIYSRIFFFMI